jgi:hypothetical protein
VVEHSDEGITAGVNPEDLETAVRVLRQMAHNQGSPNSTSLGFLIATIDPGLRGSGHVIVQE